MKTDPNPCDVVNLQVLLDGDEDSELFHSAARHVEFCPACQQRLTELSGDAEHWSSQREMLRPVAGDRIDSVLFCRYRSSQTAAWKRHAADEARVTDLLAPPSHPEMLGRLGRYEIERIIGTGGMGIVLKGFDSELNRPVAIKLLSPLLARVGAARQRFAREARAAAAVMHDHVVPIHNVDSEQTIPFLVMKFIAGESLQDRVDREGPLSVAEMLRIGMQAASGLAAAHAQGLVHRDVKPANVLLEKGVERAYLTDFGLARASDDASLTHTGVVAGTPHYMSPEQADGQPVDHRSDLFSLGSVLYFMGTGHPPFRAERPMAVLKRTCHDPHRPARQCNAEIPHALSEIIDRLLAKKPQGRFVNATELEQALARVLADVQQGRISGGRGRQSRWERRARALAIVTTVAISIGLLLVVLERASKPMFDGEFPVQAPVRATRDDTVRSPDHDSSQSAGLMGAELKGISAITQLESIDPSPPVTAQLELASLSRILDTLESTPFPEAQFGIDISDVNTVQSNSATSSPTAGENK